MKLDHIAYRVKDRLETAAFFQGMFGYSFCTEFNIEFDDGSVAKCVVMVPPVVPVTLVREGHEIFISDGDAESIVGKWVKARGGIGGVHHMAYRVKDIDDTVEGWKKQDIVEFLTDDIIDCPDDDLRQIFTKPLDYMGGIIIELIERGAKGFCQNSVKNLMESTKELK
mgnify:CR=1 FL=1